MTHSTKICYHCSNCTVSRYQKEFASGPDRSTHANPRPPGMSSPTAWEHTEHAVLHEFTPCELSGSIWPHMYPSGLHLLTPLSDCCFDDQAIALGTSVHLRLNIGRPLEYMLIFSNGHRVDEGINTR